MHVFSIVRYIDLYVLDTLLKIFQIYANYKQLHYKLRQLWQTIVCYNELGPYVLLLCALFIYSFVSYYNKVFHKKKLVNLFCLKCNELICAKCMNQSHGDHSEENIIIDLGGLCNENVKAANLVYCHDCFCHGNII